MCQDQYWGSEPLTYLNTILMKYQVKKSLLVCGKSFWGTSLAKQISELTTEYVVYSDYSSNPRYEDVMNAVQCFLYNGCDSLIVIGGGSAIDVAKSVKAFAHIEPPMDNLEHDIIKTDIPLIAIPSTAGTGSESTTFAVIYMNGIKQSIDDEALLPNHVVFVPELLLTLPDYIKACTIMDALCQAIESWWSINSTDESKEYSSVAIKTIMECLDDYFNAPTPNILRSMMKAANYSGRAINITYTTAPHAMSYILTSEFNLPHGHAVALVLPVVWEYMQCNLASCVDSRGIVYLKKTFDDIAKCVGANTANSAIRLLKLLVSRMSLHIPRVSAAFDTSRLVNSVNADRLKNNPIQLNDSALHYIYNEILFGNEDTKS